MMNEIYRSNVEIIQNAFPGAVTLSTKQVASVLGKSVHTVERMRARKELCPISKYHAPAVYTVDAVARYLSQM